MRQLEKAVKLGAKTASIYDELGSINQKIAALNPKQVEPLTLRAIKSLLEGN